MARDPFVLQQSSKKGARILFVKLGGGSKDYIEGQLKKYRTEVSSLPATTTEANRRAVVWLSNAAQKELRRRIRYRGREQSTNQSLVELAGDYRLNSSYSSTRFLFFDPAKVRKSDAAPYYRAIELGSRHMVGKTVPLVFLRGNRYVEPQEGPGKDYVTYRGREGNGDAEGRPYVVRIKNPIPAYHYVTNAVERFRDEQIYKQTVLGLIRQRAPNLYRTIAGTDLAAIRNKTGSTGRA